MELQKSNETVWSIKRRGIPGRFILRSSELIGEIRRVSLSLEDGSQSVTFDMKYPEFINFFGILSSFKSLIESPDHILAQQSSREDFSMEKSGNPQKVDQNDSLSDFSFEEQLETLTAKAAPEINDDRQAQLDEGLKNLEELFTAFSSKKTEKNDSKVSIEVNKKENTPILSSPKVNISSSTNSNRKNIMSEKISNSMKSTHAQVMIPSHKKKLQETDWDPW